MKTKKFVDVMDATGKVLISVATLIWAIHSLLKVLILSREEKLK